MAITKLVILIVLGSQIPERYFNSLLVNVQSNSQIFHWCNLILKHRVQF